MDLTSIVIVTCSQLEHTRQCLASVADFTPEPYELVLVDNGSSDGTVEFLKAVGSRQSAEGKGIGSRESGGGEERRPVNKTRHRPVTRSLGELRRVATD